MNQARSEGKIAYFRRIRLIIRERTKRHPMTADGPVTRDAEVSPLAATTTAVDARPVGGISSHRQAGAGAVTQGEDDDSELATHTYYCWWNCSHVYFCKPEFSCR